MRRSWVESIRQQCRRQRVAFFFKQWGGTRKSRTGRTLNGRTYDELPARPGLAPPPAGRTKLLPVL